MWYRVFCRADVAPAPAELLAALESEGLSIRGDFRGDDLGWTAVAISLGPGTPVQVERYLADADDLRDDLNSWAAYLETLDYSPNNGRLMEHVFQSRQMVTVRRPLDHPNEIEAERACLTIARLMAFAADGIYQVEGDGWYDGSGELLLKEY
ncbi:MAG TPA: hypothetical protein VM597_29940 [Gemmataceae bacterium]|jgi:hypothetical protein|nr:hypothetical protein [Gemmataceae bacterium]